VINSVHTAPQFVEYRNAAVEDRTAKLCGFHALRAAVQETHAEREFELCDRFGDDRMRDTDKVCSLRHRAGMCNREQDMKIAQFDSTADAV
jgi:hypothetical protein